MWFIFLEIKIYINSESGKSDLESNSTLQKNLETIGKCLTPEATYAIDVRLSIARRGFA